MRFLVLVSLMMKEMMGRRAARRSRAQRRKSRSSRRCRYRFAFLTLVLPPCLLIGINKIIVPQAMCPMYSREFRGLVIVVACIKARSMPVLQAQLLVWLATLINSSAAGSESSC